MIKPGKNGLTPFFDIFPPYVRLAGGQYNQTCAVALSLKVLLIVLVLLSMAGCASMGPGPVFQIPAGAPVRAEIGSVPFYAQKRYQCGPAALAMVLQWSGVDLTPDELVPLVYLPDRKGSLQSGLLTAARRHQRLAYPIEGLDCLIREVAAGRPVVVLQNLGLSWLPRWHYAVVIGYDLEARCIVLHTGEREARAVGVRTFLNTWKRADQWGLCVLSPGCMPECAQEQAYLKASLGLQQAAHPKAALQAFRAAVARWPSSARAYLALGNALYSDGLPRESMQAFHKAVDLEPGNGAALNNLAHLLAASGDFDQAEIMARRALAVGGIHQEVYRRTLDEILIKAGGK